MALLPSTDVFGKVVEMTEIEWPWAHTEQFMCLGVGQA